MVRRLDGIALALELAAARVPAMTPAELARRLDAACPAGGRPARAGTAPDAAGHHRMELPAARRPEQALLLRLAVLRRCTLAAAETVCGGEGIDPDAVFDC